MADLVPATAAPPPAEPPAENLGERASSLFAQPAIRKALPMLAGLGALALAAMLYLALASGPQRILYASLTDAERAQVVAALEQGGISYAIDPGSGTLTVAEDDLYRARMLVAGDGALASPDDTAHMLDSIPIGASRTLEGERLRNVREQELTRTIMEIDGVEAVRVHLAQAERSVFLRENAPPTASVMVRLARGRSLSDDQVRAIVNLVSGSVPGMEPGMVRVVDQRGQLLSERQREGGEGLQLQREYEDKLRAQVAGLLVPMLGDGSFSTEVQVVLDMEEVTRARETYDKDGTLRSERVSESTSANGAGAAGGIPGVLANTPPQDPELVSPAEAVGAAPAAPAQVPANGAMDATRTYELDREVAVSTNAPGAIKRLSVAVAVNAEALAAIKPANAEQLEKLVAAAVGADPARGDVVAVIPGKFEAVDIAEPAFYETSWFAMIVRNAVALIAVLLALLLGVRPLLRMLTSKAEAKEAASTDPAAPASEGGKAQPGTPQEAAQVATTPGFDLGEMPGLSPSMFEEANLREQIDLTKTFAAQQPDRATDALRRMLRAEKGAPAAGTA